MVLKDYLKERPKGIVAEAYRFAEQAHKGQRRKTGDPYFTHVAAAAETLLNWRLDEATVAAGLLHDVVEDTAIPVATIEEKFGEDVAFLVEGMTKLRRLPARDETSTKVENMRKLILAVSKDLRVVFVKLADRLDNMRTLGVFSPQKQKRIALETNDIYAPLAYRLGMHNVAGELHDLAFPYLHPAEAKWLDEHVTEEYEERRAYLERFRPAVEDALRKGGIKSAAIDLRAKRRYSLYQKLQRYEMDITKIYDLVALRVIVKDVEECYAALGVIHQHWPPLPGRIKDYIALPKPNGYRSLHTTVIGPEGRSVEIQIRTEEMHREDEHGIAAHWLYKQLQDRGKKNGTAKEIARRTAWVEQLRAWQERNHEEGGDPDAFLQAMKIDFFKDRIFVITPKGDVIDLPEGATPVDFAYHIHSELGNACVGAKVNDQFTPLDHPLRSGDIVFIVTQKGKRPSEDWLKFVKTSAGRDHIRAALRANRLSSAMRKVPTKAELKITLKNRIGLLKDITAAIAGSHINIVNISVNHPPGSEYPTDRIVVGTADRGKIEKLVLKLKKIKELKEISWKLM